mgnify:CR=1 FL=1
MNRFFVDKSAIHGETSTVTGEDVRHISVVLRLQPGDALTLCDGAGTDYTARIERIQKDRVELALLGAQPSGTEPACEVTLYQGLPKAGKLESILQKCVELGVVRVVPVAMARSVVKLSQRDFEAKRDRYQRIMLEAAKQSRRGVIPQIGRLAELREINPMEYDAVIVAYEEEEERTLRAALCAMGNAKRLALVVGPEGGFDPGEIALLRGRGACCVTLGKRILRTETAGPALLAMTLYELER